jgi:hypothetical protein
MQKVIDHGLGNFLAALHVNGAYIQPKKRKYYKYLNPDVFTFIDICYPRPLTRLTIEVKLRDSKWEHRWFRQVAQK